MSDEEYTYPFALWLVKCKGVPIEVNDTGHFLGSMDKKQREELETTFQPEWWALRRDYNAKRKEHSITNALESLKRNGIPCKLNNFQNGCITATSKHGRTLTYYATTETIAGYYGTSTRGLEEFIKLCKE